MVGLSSARILDIASVIGLSSARILGIAQVIGLSRARILYIAQALMLRKLPPWRFNVVDAAAFAEY